MSASACRVRPSGLPRPAREVLLGDGAVAAHVALGDRREPLLAGGRARVRHPRVDEHEARLLADERPLADEARHAVVPDEVVGALVGRVDAVRDEQGDDLGPAHRLVQVLLEEPAGQVDVGLGEAELGVAGRQGGATRRREQPAHPARVLGGHPVDACRASARCARSPGRARRPRPGRP